MRRCLAGVAGVAGLPLALRAGDDQRFRLRYIVASSMYGTMPLETILPEVRRTGSEWIDIWPRRHGNQREQIEEMGEERFLALLDKHGVHTGILTHYNLGPFRLKEAFPEAERWGAKLLISNSRGLRGLKGEELKTEVRSFAEAMRPHVAEAEERGLTLGIENHGSSLVNSPDSIKWLLEFIDSPGLGIALAPYHLPQDAEALGELIEVLGERLVHFYAWEHGMGSTGELSVEEQLLQLPGRGPLDFGPMVGALARINYQGWTSVFMHPIPRGVPIKPTASEVTGAINRSREYLDDLAARAGH